MAADSKFDGPSMETEDPEDLKHVSASILVPQQQQASSGALAAEELPFILCCLCGVQIRSNPTNMCVNCLKSQVDITGGIQKQLPLFWCRGCGRYQKPPWVNAALESRELLAICLKKIKGISKEVKLIDARFVWTEPHSRRIKVKLTIQKEVFNGAIMQQSFVVTFVVTNLQCPECQKSYTDHTWGAVLQVRQRVKHKRTFFFLEQLLLKHNVTDKCLNVKEMPEGLDFYFTNKNQAMTMLNFLTGVVPMRSKSAKRLISADLHNNFEKYKFNIHVEVAPICKFDLVILPTRMCTALGGVSPLLLCTKVTSMLHFIDPLTLKSIDLNATQYFREEFSAILNSRQLVEYIVLDSVKQSPHSANPHVKSSKFALAEVHIARASDFGSNDETYSVISHLGWLLKPGDHVLGYDMVHANLTGDALKPMKGRELPDVILVKKHYPDQQRSNKRKFKLKRLPIETSIPLKKMDQKKDEEDMEMFMQELEEDPELRQHVNLYRRDKVKPSSSASSSSSAAATADMKSDNKNDDEDDADDIPAISNEELLDELAESFEKSASLGPGGPRGDVQMDNDDDGDDDNDDN